MNEYLKRYLEDDDHLERMTELDIQDVIGKISTEAHRDNHQETIERIIPALQTYLEMRKIIRLNTDYRAKEIGDYVEIWDPTSAEDVETGQLLFANREELQGRLIVIETGANNYYDCIFLQDHTIKRDLVLYNPTTKTKVITASRFCRLC